MKTVKIQLSRYLDMQGSGLSVEQMDVIGRVPIAMDKKDIETLLEAQMDLSGPHYDRFAVEVLGPSRSRKEPDIEVDRETREVITNATYNDNRWKVTQSF